MTPEERARWLDACRSEWETAPVLWLRMNVRDLVAELDRVTAERDKYANLYRLGWNALEGVGKVLGMDPQGLAEDPSSAERAFTMRNSLWTGLEQKPK